MKYSDLTARRRLANVISGLDSDYPQAVEVDATLRSTGRADTCRRLRLLSARPTVSLNVSLTIASRHERWQ